MSAAEVAAWLAVVGTAFGLFLQGYKVFKDRRKEQSELRDALDKAPAVRDQLELGNISGAVATLNLIIEQQSRYIEQQQQRCKAEITELEEEVLEMRFEVNQLRARLAKYEGGQV